MDRENSRSLETIVIGTGAKYGIKAVLRIWPFCRIVGALFLVRLGLRKSVSFQMRYMIKASTYADRLGLWKKYQYKFSFPLPIYMHRAIGVPEFDNSNSVTVMKFFKK